MITEYGIKAMVRKGDAGNIHFHHGQGGFQIGAEIIKVGEGFKFFLEAFFRGDMENFEIPGEKICFILQKQPQQSMPFQRFAAGALGIRSGADTKRQEFTKTAAAARAHKTVAEIH